MFEISVTGHFRAAHHLRGPQGAREPPHEHDWRVTATLAGAELDETGVLVDFSQIKLRLNTLLRGLKDCNLNEVPAFSRRSSSAENVALHLGEMLAGALPRGVHLRAVEVEEEPGCVARYLPADGGASTA